MALCTCDCVKTHVDNAAEASRSVNTSKRKWCLVWNRTTATFHITPAQSIHFQNKHCEASERWELQSRGINICPEAHQMMWTLANESSVLQGTEITEHPSPKQQTLLHPCQTWQTVFSECEEPAAWLCKCLKYEEQTQTYWNLLGCKAQQTRIKNTSAFPEFNSRDFKLGVQWMMCVRGDPTDVRKRQTATNSVFVCVFFDLLMTCLYSLVVCYQ